MIVPKGGGGRSAPVAGALACQFELAPAPFEDACTGVAQLYLPPSVNASPADPTALAGPTSSTIAKAPPGLTNLLTVNGQPFVAPFSH
ncbi:hypothetical protein [Pandoraea sputorum]|uniref:hypothetical protein n=1 Tax=Pandoraea sputorum TaxID=93222 RepID=UPI001241B58E|nr:hypothetical protein [Pandoraea sputorum]VVE56473.1 hypothetical protein PSP20601_05073 [Pandoraea sputorum]